MKGLLIAAAAAALCACAAPQRPQQPARPAVVVNTEPPRCTSQRECERMWMEAQERIQALTRMRLRLVTDTRLETFAATDYGRLTGVVTKWPVGQDAYELRVELQCYRGTNCGDLPAQGTNLFNRLVGAGR